MCWLSEISHKAKRRRLWRQNAESARERGMPKTAAFYENLLRDK
jgi:hypothetical protein